MTPDELKRLDKPDLIARLLDLQMQLENALDDLREERFVSANLDQAAMSYRNAWRTRARMDPQSSRDIPRH